MYKVDALTGFQMKTTKSAFQQKTTESLQIEAEKVEPEPEKKPEPVKEPESTVTKDESDGEDELVIEVFGL